MSSLAQREHEEKLRSAREAHHAHDDLLVRPKQVARYRLPPATTDFPLEYAFHLLGDVKGKTILEYGCGDGENTVVLANRGARVIALDLSPELLAIARRRLEANRCEAVDLLVGSAHSLPLPDESVDVIFGIAILHHLDLELASREVRRVLTKGGRGIFLEPLRNSKLINRLRKLLPDRADVSPLERPLTDEEIRNFSAPYGSRGRTFQLALSSLASLSPYLTRRAIRFSAHVDAYILRLFPALGYYGTIRVFELRKE